jgi:hypothetical protein
MGYQPTLVDTTISGSTRTVLKLEAISIAPNGIETSTLDGRGLSLPASQPVTFGAFGSLTPQSDGVFTLLNTGGTSFGRLQFGGTTSSFMALAYAATGPVLAVVKADNSANGLLRCGGIHLNTNTLSMSGTAPTISSGFGTSPSIVSSNGSPAFTLNVGTGGAATSGVIGLPVATTGWIVWVQNFTAQAAGRAAMSTTAGVPMQTASTTSSVTITNINLATGGAVAWTASDVLLCTAFAY